MRIWSGKAVIDFDLTEKSALKVYNKDIRKTFSKLLIEALE